MRHGWCASRPSAGSDPTGCPTTSFGVTSSSQVTKCLEFFLVHSSEVSISSITPFDSSGFFHLSRQASLPLLSSWICRSRWASHSSLCCRHRLLYCDPLIQHLSSTVWVDLTYTDRLQVDNPCTSFFLESLKIAIDFMELVHLCGFGNVSKPY